MEWDQNTTTSVWNGIKSAIETPLNKAKNIVKSVIDTIKGFFNFNISWPHIPMPHFSITPRGWGVGDLLKGKIPKLGIDWYAKAMNEPRILDGAQIFGAMGGRLLGGGEAGQEVLYGRAQLMRDISTAVQEAKSEYKDSRPIVINIYAKDQDEKKIAEEVSKILNKEIKRRTF